MHEVARENVGMRGGKDAVDLELGYEVKIQLTPGAVFPVELYYNTAGPDAGWSIFAGGFF